MNKSDSISEIFPAIAKARLAVGVAIKNATNPHLKSKYADLGAVMDAIEPALVDNNLTPLQLPVESEDSRLHLETVIFHKSGEWISGIVCIPLAKQDAQSYGSAMTYARRYALATMFYVIQDDDDGARATAKREEDAANQPAYESQIFHAQTLLTEYGRTWEQLSSVYPADHRYKDKPIESVTTEDMATIIKFVRGRIDATDKQTA